MGSKAFLFLGLLLACVLLLSSEFAASIANTNEDATTTTITTNGIDDAKYDGKPGGRHGGKQGHGGHGGHQGHGGKGGKSGGCPRGCCWGNHGKFCIKCCSYAGEAADAQYETKPQN